MRGLISCVGNPYPLFAMATQSHLSTQPCQYLKKCGKDDAPKELSYRTYYRHKHQNYEDG